MQSLHIRRIHAQYRLDGAAAAERPRLDNALRAAANDMLGVAVSHTGLPETEILCLRSVHVRTRLDLARGADDLAAKWSLDMAEAIRLAADSAARTYESRSSDSEQAVRYRSLAAAMEDHLHCVARRDYARAWVWRQLSFWPTSEVPSERQALIWTLQTFSRNSGMIVPILASAGRSGWMPKLEARLDEADWITLSSSAWAGAHPGLCASPGVIEGDTSGAVDLCAQRILARSTLLAAISPSAFRSRAMAETFAALALLECEPALVLKPEYSIRIRAALAQRLHRTGPDRISTQTGAREIATDPRPLANSRFGGLLYLINLISGLEIPTALVAFAGLRSVAWSLHQLTGLLCTAEPGDPARLAFAGLVPGDVPPDRGEPPATSEELEALDEVRSRVCAALEARLYDVELRGSNILDWVCRRSCTLAADPGWIEVRFPLDAVSTSIRRARLDLNPGYQPWLGITVMFVYE